MDDTDTDAMLEALQTESPVGPNLEYDAEMILLEDSLRRVADAPACASTADWNQVARLGASLARRTRDLRVALPLLRAWTRVDGLPGCRRGLELVLGLMNRHWQDMHPQFTHWACEDEPLAMRRSALLSLDDPRALLGDLCAVQLGQWTCGAIHDHWHDGGAADDSAIVQSITQALREQERSVPGTLQCLIDIDAHVVAIARAWRELAGNELSNRAQQVTGSLAAAARFASGDEPDRPRLRRAEAGRPAQPAPKPVSTEEAVAALAAARAWLDRLGLEASDSRGQP